MRGCLHLLVVACLVWFTGQGELEAKTFEESQVKAVFLFNLTKFITWPPSDGEKRGFIIGVVSKDPIKKHLVRVVKNETVEKRKIKIKEYSSISKVNWQQLDMLFIGSNLKHQVREIASVAHLHQVLTVGDVSGFCQSDGMINLLTVDKRVKLEINLESVKKGRLKVSAQVLKLAKLVKTLPETGQ